MQFKSKVFMTVLNSTFLIGRLSWRSVWNAEQRSCLGQGFAWNVEIRRESCLRLNAWRSCFQR